MLINTTATLCLALATASAAPAPAPAAAGKVKVLVLDLRDDGVGANAVRILHDSIAADLSKDGRVEVLSSEDMRRTLDVEAQKRAAGCAADDSCLAEIAGALGARVLLYGNAGKLGDLVVVNLNLFDADQQKSVGRETIQADKVDAILPKLGDATARLLEPLFGPPAAPSPLLWTGVVVGGVGALGAATGLILGAVGESGVTPEKKFADNQSSKDLAAIGWHVAVISLGAVVAGAAVAGVGAAAGD